VDTGATGAAEVTEVAEVGGPADSATGVAVVGVRGRLDLAARAVRAELERLLRERRRVVADVSGAAADHGGAVHLFLDAVENAGGWPEVALVLAAPDATLAALLTGSRVAHYVPVHPDVATAIARVDERPELVRAWWHFDVDARAPRIARAHVRRVCADWDVGVEVCEAAQIVVTELVTNAVEHAGSKSVVEVERVDGAFRIGVRDYDTTELGEVTLPPPQATRGRGLAMVAAVSRAWGVRTHPDGKTIWSEMTG